MATLITDLTDGTVDGEGIFDKLMASGEAHLKREYQNNRITGKEYSTVYLGMMQSAMAQSIQFLTAAKQADLLTQKKITEAAQVEDLATGLIGKQQTLVTAQSDGFARNAEQQLLKIMTGVHVTHRAAVGATIATPDGLTDPNITSMVESAFAGLGVTYVPLPA